MHYFKFVLYKLLVQLKHMYLLKKLLIQMHLLFDIVN